MMMRHPHLRPITTRHALIALAILGLIAASLLGRIHRDLSSPQEPPDAATVMPPTAPGPPWIYGRGDARYTIIEYADLECPYCRTHFPVLKQWITAYPEVALQWRHLPASTHEPAASREARLVECAGEAHGHAAFWDAIAWVYAHTRGDGQGLPEDAPYPKLTPAIHQCLNSDRPDAIIRAQAAEAVQRGVKATPTLELRDRVSGKTLLLPGPIEGDALLSALDLLTVSDAAITQPPAQDMPVGAADDMPR